MAKVTGGVIYKLSVFFIMIVAVLSLNRIGIECHKMYREIKGVRIEMARANSTARGCTKKVADEISAVRKEGTKVRVWFW